MKSSFIHLFGPRHDLQRAGGIKASHLPKDISMERIHSLPESTGVYYFYNEYGHVIYVGKSINIRKRIMQHFGNMDDKTDKFIKKEADITYEETGNELVAMLLESSEIKALQPEINKAQRTKDYPYFIHHYVILKATYGLIGICRVLSLGRIKLS